MEDVQDTMIQYKIKLDEYDKEVKQPEKKAIQVILRMKIILSIPTITAVGG